MTFTLGTVQPRRRRRALTPEKAAVAARLRRAQADIDAAEARKLAAAVEWAHLHEVDDAEDAESWGEAPILLGGEGCTMVESGCAAQLGTLIHTTTHGARAYLADALELANRLPAVYAEIQAGRLVAWRGRRIARETAILPKDAAIDLGERIAPLAGKLSASRTQQMIDETVAAVMPEYAQALADKNATHKVVVDHRQVSFLGTSAIYGALDLADALDLDARLTHEAAVLKEAGCDASLDVRRAMALGNLARGETSTGRAVTLYVHLPAGSDHVAVVENGGNRLVTQAQVAAWCGNPDVRVTVKPVVDLGDTCEARQYVVPDRIKERVELRDRTCVFPYCARSARACQKDHITAYDDGGATSTTNLAALCQHHHNLKTHQGWTYTMVELGVYLWRSPLGHAYLRDRQGTQDLTPRPVDPPGT